jgi:uncharacterized protein YlzI (FlbEa/FlbD family)
MAKLIEIGANTFLNTDMVVSINSQGTVSTVTLVNGKTITVSMDAQALAKKCMAGER